MDIFRYRNPTNPTKMEQGEVVNGLKTKAWVERYREAGEFTFTADASTDIREKLPIGSLISHSDTTEIMIVENHEIQDAADGPTEITISGRSFETILEQRVVGSNKSFPTLGEASDYVQPADYTWNQALALINDHILASSVIDPYDALPYVQVLNGVAGTGASLERSFKKGSLYGNLLSLLEVDDLGIRIIRPGLWSPLGAASPDTALVVHVGTDRSKEIVFSYDTGEIEAADYLWTNKARKTSALVSGRWVEVRVDSLSDTEYNRRMMYVDAQDIDQDFPEAPADTDLYNVIVRLEQRGQAALAAQRNIALTRAEVSKESTRAVYRQDFEVGDLITVSGDYNERSTMRISEYVEIEDQNGMSAYPTLTMNEGA